jgi:hypothetical protein
MPEKTVNEVIRDMIMDAFGWHITASRRIDAHGTLHFAPEDNHDRRMLLIYVREGRWSRVKAKLPYVGISESKQDTIRNAITLLE